MPSSYDEYVAVSEFLIHLFDLTCCYCHPGRNPSPTISLVDLDEDDVESNADSNGPPLSY